LREAFASLLHASPDEICVTRNTTEGLNIVMNGLTWQPGDEIITCDLEHSSVLTPSYVQQHRRGAVVKLLRLAPDEDPASILEKIEAAISDRTKLVFLSHVEYSSGLRMPVTAIRSLTRERGVLMLLDGAQTAGHLDLDMADMGCDFYSVPAQKWLLGPEGVGALFVRRDLIPGLQPAFVAGRAALHPEDPYGFEPNETSIDKFLLTSTSAALQAGALEAIRFVREIGVAEIESRDVELAGTLKDALAEIPGVKVLSPRDRQSSTGLVSFVIDGLSPAEAVSRLWSEHRIVCRPVSFHSSIRVSVHFFNTEEEMQQVAGAVQGMA
jgi:L-cysteine/cystine lyase